MKITISVRLFPTAIGISHLLLLGLCMYERMWEFVQVAEPVLLGDGVVILTSYTAQYVTVILLLVGIITMELRFSLLLIPLLLGTILCQLDDLQKQISKQQEKQRYCGSYLATALSTVCKGKYYNTMHKKTECKYYSNNEIRKSDMPMDYPFQERATATSLMGKGGTYRRNKRYGHGVYNECCEKSCTHEELEGYCAEPSRRRR
ncbi:unnamed protein product [Phaedon cochleariae]|uniref:Insulin-like domain-containing protein n=1 Tax=Phaedon cochleariae TaxID=80249 RepID=A0A9N9SI13_PHACE|nr:unnamed protein product [Phaedon cochleariae]